MKRLTVNLPDELYEALVNEARNHRVPVSQLAREALQEWFDDLARLRVKVPFARIGRSGHGNLSREVDEILAKEWTYERLVLGQDAPDDS